ncbi:4-hydroxythreonine-4-phosphate dehydrogenase PdxA [Xanthobacter agilis]|uniref:4-hydroxythreonine-4-phosphate dehydrogenase n=1 Tax=Xanthobacter agilis TaxID=47492 RepID=A0ABU0LF34_XANAG|nr:4-hydroxythreonine-4-phosphate dehydrogenase PdxA [Xanthobacter agilis]MDQ0505680.1 4-hydroxythreonine-4-phosphate dehydrogenase [Xanthobacter agilis]
MPRPASPPLVLTTGEPAGVGPELALKAWLARATLPAFFVVGDPVLLADRAQRLGLDVPLVSCPPAQAAAQFPTALPVMPMGPRATAAPGQPDASSADAVRASLDAAVDLVQAGAAAALVTNPLAKSVMYAAGFPFPGHTEYLAARAAERASGAEPRAVMMIWSPLLAVVPATIHVPLRQVPDLVTVDLLLETGRIVATDMRRRFGLDAPRLAFAGLNPHAGESGTLGTEDEAVVHPAVVRLCAEGIDARGPLPADTLFHPEARADYDVVIGMYHDQVLIPAKTLAFHDGVNVTLGLPFIRTSPDHGTAFDIAGTGRANPASLMAALRLARRLADTQSLSREATPA